MIENNFDIPFVADLSRREKQIQQNYRPIIAVHKWFARRPGTLFRGLLLSEFTDGPLDNVFYQPNDLSGLHVADPFMGGGIPILEANRLGCEVSGYDINPMSFWIVKQEIEHLNIEKYAEQAETLRSTLENEIGDLYRTKCTVCGDKDAHVKYFLWVKTTECRTCQKQVDLFSGYLVAADSRHPKNVIICSKCNQINESEDRADPGKCIHCNHELKVKGSAKRNSCSCPHCQASFKFPDPALGAPKHRLFAMEYHCHACKQKHKGRFFKVPDDDDLGKTKKASERLSSRKVKYIPDDKIPKGDETNRLHRWGYQRYREMFNDRQLLGLELSACLISEEEDVRCANALATNLSDLLRYQNMLCRYDTRALKSLDIFSIHGFPVGLIQCESNILGIREPGKNLCVGSGGWANIIDKFSKAKAYCDNPFEVKFQGKKKLIVPIEGEWIGDEQPSQKKKRRVNILCKDAATIDLPENSLDAVFTDPPYFGNVQYAELMDFCYVWLKQLIGQKTKAFSNLSTRADAELTGNAEMGRGLEHFSQGMSKVFRKMRDALKNGSPLTFTYHHNKLEAYYPIAVAILDAGLTCSASLPCPAEMGASIHINGTGSSIIDTIFVCRTTGITKMRWLADTPEELARIVESDIALLEKGNMSPSKGDIRCIIYGHLIRLCIWELRTSWENKSTVTNKIVKISDWIRGFGGYSEVEKNITYLKQTEVGETSLFSVNEALETYGVNNVDVPF